MNMFLGTIERITTRSLFGSPHMPVLVLRIRVEPLYQSYFGHTNTVELTGSLKDACLSLEIGQRVKVEKNVCHIPVTVEKVHDVK